MVKCGRYVRYVNKEFFQMPFPFDDDVLKPYMSHIAKTSSHSVLSGFIEVVAFMEHVLGFIVPNGFYNDPWTKGTLRGMKMARKATTSIQDAEGVGIATS